MKVDDLKNYISSGSFSYVVNKRDKKSNIYDLLILIENEGYRFASFNTKTKRLTIPFAETFIPTNEVLFEFIKIAKEQENE